VETRQQFISRMIWMVKEIDSSNLNSLDSLSMLDYELKKRDNELMKQMRDLIINFIDRYKVKPHNAELFRKLSVKTEIRFNQIIRKLE